MLVISALARRTVLVKTSRYGYHAADLLRRSTYDNLISIYEPANHLYVDKLLKHKLEEKSFTRLILQQLKITENDEIFSKIIKYLEQNLHNVQDFRTISTMMVLLYQKKYEQQNFIMKLAHRGFLLLSYYEMYKIPLQGYSYTVVRFFIALEKLLDISKFTDQQFKCINPQRIKPLFNVFLLQIFWKNNLQQKYILPKLLLDTLHKNKQLIPYSDLHHMTHAKKTVRTPKYAQIIDFMHNKLKKQMISNQNEVVNKSNTVQISRTVVKKMYEEYYTDLQNKYI